MGEGSVIRDGALTGTTFPATGSATSKFFFRNGRLFTKETYTMSAPNVFGIAPITGAGTCTSGTDSHFGETCTYTLKGSFDMFTRVTDLTLTGTYTPGRRSRRPRRRRADPGGPQRPGHSRQSASSSATSTACGRVGGFALRCGSRTGGAGPGTCRERHRSAGRERASDFS